MHTWDLRTQRCIHRQADEGSLVGTALAVSPASHTLATGSDSGVVNIYKQSPAKASAGPGSPLSAAGIKVPGAGGMPLPLHRPPAVKSFMNLRTEVDTLSFSPDGQVRPTSNVDVCGHVSMCHCALGFGCNVMDAMPCMHAMHASQGTFSCCCTPSLRVLTHATNSNFVLPSVSPA